jgi:Ca-activated chloride channel homolog
MHNMKWFKFLLIFTLALITVNAFAQKERKYIRQGNKEFESTNFENSEVSYRKAVDLEEEKTHEPAFNVGDALYKQEKYEDAIKQFESLADVEVSKEEKAKIYHNLGNSLLQNNKLKESVEAYKNALRNNPNDLETKYNLAYAQKKLEQQQQQQNQDQNKDKDKKDQDKNKDQNEDQQNKDDQNKENEDQNKDQDKQDQNKEQQQQQQQQPQISKADAERILQALANDEKDTQKKVKEQQAAAAKVKTEKEW